MVEHILSVNRTLPFVVEQTDTPHDEGAQDDDEKQSQPRSQQCHSALQTEKKRKKSDEQRYAKYLEISAKDFYIMW